MRWTLVLIGALLVSGLLGVQAASDVGGVVTEDVRLECSEAGTPALLRSSTAKNAVENLVTKLFKCLEKTATGAYKVVLNIIKDVTSCVSKLPSADFFKCLAKFDVPQKVAEIVNAVMETVRCVS